MESLDAYIGRQPILDRMSQVMGYELLFRSGLVNAIGDVDLDEAASSVIANSLFFFTLEALTGGRKAFINVTEDALLRDYVTALPKDKVVIELLETIEPTAEVVRACQKLKEMGYSLALDDFEYHDRWRPLIQIADIIKVDLLLLPHAEQAALMKAVQRDDVIWLAEKVENQEQYEQARNLGYHLFQGYFFARPTIVSKQKVPGFKTHYLKIMKEINRPDVDFGRVAEMVGEDATLTYNLLRYINSAYFSFKQEIRSISQAVVAMGELNLKKWANLALIAAMGREKPFELLVSAGVRAHVCEQLAYKSALEHRASECFLMGMFSLIDAIVDRPLAELLRDVPLARDVKQGLLRFSQNPFRLILECVEALERTRWDDLDRWSEKLGIAPSDMMQAFLDGVSSAQKAFVPETA